MKEATKEKRTTRESGAEARAWAGGTVQGHAPGRGVSSRHRAEGRAGGGERRAMVREAGAKRNPR